MDILGIDVNLGQGHAWSVMVKNAQSSLPVPHGNVGRSLLTSDRTLSTLTSRLPWQVAIHIDHSLPTLAGHLSSARTLSTLTSRLRWPVTIHIDHSLPTVAGTVRIHQPLLLTVGCIDQSLYALSSHCPKLLSILTYR
jgi:hypothetical protein